MIGFLERTKTLFLDWSLSSSSPTLADNHFLLLVRYLALSEHQISIYIGWPWQHLYFHCHNTSYIRWVTKTPRVHVFITAILIQTYLFIFYRVETATFFPYVIPFLIPVDDYACIQLFPSQFFILCLCIVLDKLFSGFDLVHISNTLLGWGRSHL